MPCPANDPASAPRKPSGRSQTAAGPARPACRRSAGFQPDVHQRGLLDFTAERCAAGHAHPRRAVRYRRTERAGAVFARSRQQAAQTPGRLCAAASRDDLRPRRQQPRATPARRPIASARAAQRCRALACQRDSRQPAGQAAASRWQCRASADGRQQRAARRLLHRYADRQPGHSRRQPAALGVGRPADTSTHHPPDSRTRSIVTPGHPRGGLFPARQARQPGRDRPVGRCLQHHAVAHGGS